MRKMISLFLVITLICVSTIATFNVSAEEYTDSYIDLSGASRNSYRAYLSKFDNTLFSEEIVLIPDSSNLLNLTGGAKFSDNTITFVEEDSSAEFTFSIGTDSNYRIELEYIPDIKSNFGSSVIGLLIDGKYPFDEAKELELSWRWNNSEVFTDSRGNEMLSSMTAIGEITKNSLCDPSGRQEYPLIFHFEKGTHTLSIVAKTGNFTLNSIRFYPIDDPVPYQRNNADSTKGQNIILEAEDFDKASSTTLSPDYDKSSVMTSPNDAQLLLYNYIPGTKYTTSGQWLEWKFIPKETGLYHISFRARQSSKSGFSVVRRLYINGEIPFEEASEILFDYSTDWCVNTFGNSDEPYEFLFEKDKEYTIKLEVTAGSLSEITNRVDDIVYELNSLSRSVIMVVGNDPDKYRDYQIDTVIKDFDKTIKSLRTELESIVSDLKERNAGRSGSTLSSFHSLINRLEKIEEDPDILAKSLSSFKSDIQGLSAWNQDAKTQPLDLDYIRIHSADIDAGKGEANFFSQLLFDTQRILCSFVENYGTVGDIYDEDSSLEVWMNSGRDQMSIVKKMIDNSFSKEYGINVNVSLVSVDIRSVILAGAAPDVSLFLSGDMPVNLALRGSVEDLSKFDSFDNIAKRFEEHSLVPFAYSNGCYALPIAETFNMMFVRTDIFEELDLEVPETWDDFYRVSTILQRNNLEVGIPTNIGMFATLLFQNGGNFYTNGGTATDFGSDAAINAFETWTGLFSQYGFPLTYEFYNRFSSGEMPLAIIDYTQYLKMEAASPELSGRWEMFLIPGVKKADGSIDRTLSISGATGADTSPGLAQSVSSAVIFSQSDKKDEAWKFLDWFTSDETQGVYGREIEDALGSISRYTSANINAFKMLPWGSSERKLLEEQRSHIKSLNEISGNYSVTRELINAFRKVVYQNKNATDTIYTYSKKINKELERKNSK